MILVILVMEYQWFETTSLIISPACLSILKKKKIRKKDILINEYAIFVIGLLEY